MPRPKRGSEWQNRAAGPDATFSVEDAQHAARLMALEDLADAEALRDKLNWIGSWYRADRVEDGKPTPGEVEAALRHIEGLARQLAEIAGQLMVLCRGKLDQVSLNLLREELSKALLEKIRCEQKELEERLTEENRGMLEATMARLGELEISARLNSWNRLWSSLELAISEAPTLTAAAATARVRAKKLRGRRQSADKILVQQLGDLWKEMTGLPATMYWQASTETYTGKCWPFIEFCTTRAVTAMNEASGKGDERTDARCAARAVRKISARTAYGALEAQRLREQAGGRRNR